MCVLLMNKLEFEAILSGDWECACWDVDIDVFRNIVGFDPDDSDKSRFHDNKYRIYNYCVAPECVNSGDICVIKVKYDYNRVIVEVVKK